MLILGWSVLASVSTCLMKTTQDKSFRIHAPQNMRVFSVTASMVQAEVSTPENASWRDRFK